MFKKIADRFRATVYLQIWEHRIKAVDIQSNSVFEDQPLVAIKTGEKGAKNVSDIGSAAKLKAADADFEVVNPFSHPRVLFADFHVGEKLLQLVFKQLLGSKLLSPAPAVIIHPMEKTEGGLTMIEKRALIELGMGAGARDVLVYEGQELSVQDIDFEALKDASGLAKRPTASPVARLLSFSILVAEKKKDTHQNLQLGLADLQ